jgi:hypothetical protein
MKDAITLNNLPIRDGQVYDDHAVIEGELMPAEDTIADDRRKAWERMKEEVIKTGYARGSNRYHQEIMLDWMCERFSL